MTKRNLLIIMSDEHNTAYMGCAGHPFISTPHLDALAARGTRFTSAYTSSPICVPARASFALGRYNHDVGFWENVDAYEGSIPSWHHVLRAAGHTVTSIGKLHFRGRAGDDHGFTEEIIPMHITGGHGDIKMLLRNPPLMRGGGAKLCKSAKPGESDYTRYDRDIVAHAHQWLHERAPPAGASGDTKPWCLFVSLVAPHFPLTAPAEHYYRYADQNLPMPKLYAPDQRPQHPYVLDYARIAGYDLGFHGPDDVRRGIAGYCGLVSFMDEQVGKILAALQTTGWADSTNILYTSDHGDNVGARGLWGKSNMYEEAAGVPMIMAGPDVQAGRVVRTPVSHVDVFPTVLEAVGAQGTEDLKLAGESLFGMAADRDRHVMSEYHAIGSTSGVFMLRTPRFKYVRYAEPGYPPQLFDLVNDPGELVDLGCDPGHQGTLADCEAALNTYCSPEQTDRRCKARQAELLEYYGGREKALAMGDLGYTPAPGTRPEFNS